ncbi:DUF418 domain-containing protein [Corynebacterium sp.]|uniref:DUF418 domain-containing protein n=1 Tax=Corynebacterium sp. TaxID=1720 RepID=UPI0026DAE554|nr:DUF418 domain-containing protein [Corynebacterium sp.]MDO5031882.1 DUF418 domain-containing protein [Corynebacterium sp.]
MHHDRLLFPDVARGLALLGIALANVCTAWIATEHFGGVDTTADKTYAVFSAMFVHVRGLPMFSTLLGFGVGLITMSLWRKGFPLRRARVVIAKRYGYLALFGALHLIFLFYGDIMMFYGLGGIVIALCLSLTDKVLLRASYVLLGLQALLGIALAVLFGILGGAEPSIAAEFSTAELDMDAESYPMLLLYNLGMFFAQLLSSPVYLLQLLPVMFIGFVWARRGTLARAETRELMPWILILVAVIFLVGLPWGLAAIGVLPTALELPLEMVNSTLGILTGPGIVALTALALRSVRGLPWWLWPLAALGKRSMTGYLLQSVFFFALVHPFTLNIGHDFGALGLGLLAAGVWLGTLVIACILEATGKPGPFEWVHRRLSYGPTMQPQMVPAQQALPASLPGASGA